MLWFEVIAGEGITLMIGYFGKAENLAAHAIVYSTLSVSFILPVRLVHCGRCFCIAISILSFDIVDGLFSQNSWSIGAQTRIGNLVGAGKAMKARATTFIAVIFSVFWMLMHTAIIFLLPAQLISIYSTDAGRF
jgi:hypothetical protein